MGKTPKETRNELLGKTVVKALESRHFEAYYCANKEEALEKAISLIPEESSVSWGGSVTIREMGLTKALHEGNYQVIDRDLAKDAAEMQELHKKGLLTDYFLMSTNGISEDGILVNIDGTGNRVAALCFGPKNVIVLCGINKVAQNLDAAVTRARTIAAPINSARFMGNTPCAIGGTCKNCKSEESICAQVVVTRVCKPANRIKVIVIGEEIGY